MRPPPFLAAAAACTGLCALAAPAAAQLYNGGLLPNVGTDTRVGDIRPQIESYLARNSPPPATHAPDWLITPSIGASLGFTDNAQRVEAPRRADVFTQITPGITVSRDAARLKLNASYSPSITVYASQSSQNNISQYANGQALLTLAPDTLFLDVRGSITQSSLVGNGYATQNNTTNFNRQNQVATYTLAINPYATHRFGGWGNGRVGYSLSRSIQDTADNQATLFGTNVLGTQAYGATGNLTTQTEDASFVTGENLGRFNNTTSVTATQYSGGGSYRGAHRNEVSNELGYALTRKVTLLAGLGYQDIAYNGLPPYRLNEPTFNGGVRYIPNADSSITVLYGRRDGGSNVSFDGTFAPTARTRVVGRYSTGITSDLQDAQAILSSTTYGADGSLSDSVTGAPIASSSTSGTQNGIYRVKRFSLSGVLLQNRDSYSLSLTQEDRTTLSNTTSLLTNAVVPAGTSTSSLFTSVSWQHDLAPDTSSTVSAQYGSSNSTSQLVTGAGGGQQRTISLSATVTKQFTQTLSGSLRYTFTDQSGGTGVNTTVFNPLFGRTFNTGAYTENVVLLGLRKSF